MFVDQLLFAFTFHDHSEIVEAPDLAADLEAIEQIDYNGLFFHCAPGSGNCPADSVVCLCQLS